MGIFNSPSFIIYRGTYNLYIRRIVIAV